CVLSTSARPPSPRLCPYTTLFRSEDDGQGRDRGSRCEREVAAAEPAEPEPLLDHPRVGLRRRELSERVEAAPFGLELLECLAVLDRKSTRLNSSHVKNSYAVFCLK